MSTNDNLVGHVALELLSAFGGEKVKMKYILIVLVLTGSALAQSQRLTNQTIRGMVHGGVPVSLIVQAIRSADRFSLESSDAELSQLIADGASETDAQEIMRAIEEHGAGVKQEHVMSAVRALVTPVSASISPAPYTVQRLMLGDGTPVRLRLAMNLSSAEAWVGQSVPFEVLDEVKVGNVVVIAKGAHATGSITGAQEKRRMGRAGRLAVMIDSVQLVNGGKAALLAGRRAKGGSHVGMVTTAVVLTSAAVGLPVGSLWLLKHGDDATLPKGTEVTATVDGDAPLEVMSNDAANVPARQNALLGN